MKNLLSNIALLLCLAVTAACTSTGGGSQNEFYGQIKAGYETGHTSH